MFYGSVAGTDDRRRAVASRLHALQQALDLTDSEMARGAGLNSANAWWNYRTGTRQIPFHVCAAIKSRWGVTLDWIGANDASGNPPDLQKRIDVALRHPRPFSRGRRPSEG